MELRTLDEAILHAEEEVKRQLSKVDALEDIPMFGSDPEDKKMIDACYQCAEEHRQLAVWLKELKLLREQTGWIPITERLPEENKTVIVSTKYCVYPEARYTKENGWEWAYESGADYWKELEDVEAWMPLPKTYEAESKEEMNEF